MAGRNGHSSEGLKRLARRVDAQFAVMDKRLNIVEKNVISLGRDVRGLRKSTKELFDYVVFMDGEFQSHRKDKAIHTGI
jgi:hypothetical protein